VLRCPAGRPAHRNRGPASRSSAEVSYARLESGGECRPARSIIDRCPDD
jgi:hypothetical protein